MARFSIPSNIDVTTYPVLLRCVKETLFEGRRRIEAQKVLTYWETGYLIQTHILKNRGRADYGGQVIARLADDLEMSVSVLLRCVQFVKYYPDDKILASRRELTWTHYRELFAISDARERSRLEDAIARGGLSIEEVRARKKVLQLQQEADASPSEPVLSDSHPGLPLVPLRGELYTYQIQRRRVLAFETSELVVDLGFSIAHNVGTSLLGRFSAGDIVASCPKEDAYRFLKSDRIAKNLYTYRSLVERVVDADTLKVHIDLGFDTWVRQTLRLRGIDAPELGTKAGDEAKAFVQSLLKESDEIIIHSSRSDKYDRYLADVYIPDGEGGEDVFLNNLLLEKGMAQSV